MLQSNFTSIIKKIFTKISSLSENDFTRDQATSINEDLNVIIDENKEHLIDNIIKFTNNEIYPKFLVNSYDENLCQIALGAISEDFQLSKIVGKSNIICGGLPFPCITSRIENTNAKLADTDNNTIKPNKTKKQLKQNENLWQNFPKNIFWIPNIYIKIKFQQNNFNIKIKVNISNKTNLNSTKENLAKLLHSLDNEQSNNLINVNFKISPVQYNPSYDEYSKYFNELQLYLEQKKATKVVLARDIYCETSVNKITLLYKLLHNQKDGYCYFYEPYKDSVYSGITPETLYARNNKNITTEALAGTFPVCKDCDSKNVSKSEIMLNDKKNFAENSVVSNYIINKLKEFCSDIEESPLEIIPSGKLFHMRKKIKAKLAKHIKNSDELILKNLHPTPSMAGNPLNQALSFIQEHEGFERLWYSGTMGFISNDQAKFYVLIRGILLNQKKCHIFTGSGVILQSKLNEEWEELDNKMYNIKSSIL